MADLSSAGIDQMINDIASMGSMGAGSGSSSMLGNVLSLLGIGAGVAGGAAGVASAYNRLGDIGAESVLGTTVDGQYIPGAAQLAAETLGLSQFRPFTVTSATGGQFGVTPTVDPSTGLVTGVSSTMGLSPAEQALQQTLMGQAQTGLVGTPFGQQMGQAAAQQAFGLGGQFMGQAGMPMAGREQDIYGRIRAVQTPEEQRQRLALEERLAQQGRLGVRTGMFGGTPEAFAMEQAQAEARNRAALAAMQQAQAEQMQQAQLGQTYSTLGSQLAAQNLAAQQAQQQLGLGALTGAYMPQAQLLNVLQAQQLYPQLQQQAQLYGVGQYGETMMSGLQARLIAEQARANLLGGIGSGLLGGLFSPVATQGGGVGSLFGSVLQDIFS